MLLGKIVIGTDGSSLEQFIRDGKNGFLAEIGKPESLYKCIKKVLNLSNEQKQEISKMAQLKIQKFDLECYSKKWECFIEKL